MYFRKWLMRTDQLHAIKCFYIVNVVDISVNQNKAESTWKDIRLYGMQIGTLKWPLNILYDSRDGLICLELNWLSALR